MNEDKNIVIFSLQFVVIFSSIGYLIYIVFSDEYFKSTPILGIVSLSVALLYFCAIGYSKFNLKNLDKHHLKLNDTFVYAFKIGYICLGILILLGTCISLFFVDSLTVRWSDALGVLTLMITLSVELITYLIFLIAKKYIVKYGES